MNRYLFDIEANNLLARAEHIWCIVIIDMDTGEVFTYNPQQLKDAVDVLRDADEVIGHNITGYDISELERHFGKIFKDSCAYTDTLVLSRLLFPKLKLSDFKLAQKLTLPSRLIGSHSLEAWGYRLGERKIEYNDYSKFTQEMLTYCVQDCKTNLKLYNHLMARYASVENKEEFDDALDMEIRVSCIISEQTVNGFYFDIKKCEELYAELSNKKEGLYQKLVKEYPPRVVEEEFIPKVNNKARGYVKGVPTIKRKVIPFNPNSNQHIARILKEEHGWKPDVFTNSGQAKVDEAILSTLDYDVIPELLEYLMLSKRLGQVGDGAMAWLKLYNHKTHCIHGLVNSMGTRTRRMTHNNPNVAQTPAKPKPYWEKCRGCFTAPPGRVLVGCDADGLELRMLAHFMSFFDGGEYAKTILYGSKEEGTDAHTLNARLLGVPRDVAKTWFYAFK